MPPAGDMCCSRAAQNIYKAGSLPDMEMLQDLVFIFSYLPGHEQIGYRENTHFLQSPLDFLVQLLYFLGGWVVPSHHNILLRMGIIGTLPLFTMITLMHIYQVRMISYNRGEWITYIYVEALRKSTRGEMHWHGVWVQGNTSNSEAKDCLLEHTSTTPELPAPPARVALFTQLPCIR